MKYEATFLAAEGVELHHVADSPEAVQELIRNSENTIIGVHIWNEAGKLSEQEVVEFLSPLNLTEYNKERILELSQGAVQQEKRKGTK
jgi:ABC-type Mn2+/Zn2+ transport system ATPase subunit